MTLSENLSPAALQALSAAVKKAASATRARLPAGEYQVDETVTLSLSGEVKVSEDEDYVPTVAIPLKVAFALFVHHSGVTGDHALAALEKAMVEALAIAQLRGKAQKEAEAAIREIAVLDEAESKVRSTLDALPAKTRQGKVRAAKVAVVAIEEAEEIADAA